MKQQTHHTLKFNGDNEVYYIPKQLAHCNSNEFTEMASLLYLWQTGVLNYNEFRVHAVIKILNIDIDSKDEINDLKDMDAFANLYQISELMDSFFYTSDEGDLIIKKAFKINPNPTITPLSKKLNGPEVRFTNVTFGQYEDALNIYQNYFRTSDKSLLYKLIAIFYQANHKKYNRDKIDSKAKQFEKYVDFGKVYGFFIFFTDFQEYVTSSKVMYENNVIDLSILFESQENDVDFKSAIPGLGFKSLAFQLAESGVFGNLNELRRENLWEVLLRLYDIRKRDLDNLAQAKEAEEKAKRKSKAI